MRKGGSGTGRWRVEKVLEPGRGSIGLGCGGSVGTVSGQGNEEHLSPGALTPPPY